jgi:hypothetical protein
MARTQVDCGDLPKGVEAEDSNATVNHCKRFLQVSVIDYERKDDTPTFDRLPRRCPAKTTVSKDGREGI